MVQMANRIDDANIRYEPFDANSNAVINTVIAAASLPPPPDKGLAMHGDADLRLYHDLSYILDVGSGGSGGGFDVGLDSGLGFNLSESAFSFRNFDLWGMSQSFLIWGIGFGEEGWITTSVTVIDDASGAIISDTSGPWRR